jgi:hypothetical protein
MNDVLRISSYVGIRKVLRIDPFEIFRGWLPGDCRNCDELRSGGGRA